MNEKTRQKNEKRMERLLKVQQMLLPAVECSYDKAALLEAILLIERETDRIAKRLIRGQA